MTSPLPPRRSASPHTHALAAFVSLAAAAGAAQAQPDLLVSQPLWQASGLNSNLLSGSAARRAADDFTLPAGNAQPYTLRRITGFMFTTLAADPDLFRLEIYRDAGGIPGDLLMIRGAASMVVEWGQFQPGIRTQQAFFDFNATLDPGRYWLSLVGLSTDVGSSRFATSGWGGQDVNGSVAMTRTGSGPWQSANSTVGPDFRDLAFSIYGTQIIPAPGAAALAGLAGVYAFRRRRR